MKKGFNTVATRAAKRVLATAVVLVILGGVCLPITTAAGGEYAGNGYAYETAEPIQPLWDDEGEPNADDCF